MASGFTEEAIKILIQQALTAQAEIHRKELAEQTRVSAEIVARLQRSSSSAVRTPPLSPSSKSTTVPRARLDMGSPQIVYNELGGTSTSALSQAAVARATGLASASSSLTSNQENLYQLLTMDQSKNERSLTERKEDPVTDSGLAESLRFFDEYNRLGGRRSLREFLGPTWLRTLERVQGAAIPDESDGEKILRSFLESIFNSPDSFNIRVESAFVAVKIELVKGRISLDAMQSYAARFAAILDNWVSRFPDQYDRVLNKRLVSYFYKGIEPEPLRSLVQHFPVDYISEVFDQFRTHCTPSVVEMVNLKTEKSFRDRQQFRDRQKIPELSRPPGGERERRAKKGDSAGAKFTPPLGDLSLIHI